MKVIEVISTLITLVINVLSKIFLELRIDFKVYFQTACVHMYVKFEPVKAAYTLTYKY